MFMDTLKDSINESLKDLDDLYEIDTSFSTNFNVLQKNLMDDSTLMQGLSSNLYIDDNHRDDDIREVNRDKSRENLEIRNHHPCVTFTNQENTFSNHKNHKYDSASSRHFKEALISQSRENNEVVNCQTHTCHSDTNQSDTYQNEKDQVNNLMHLEPGLRAKTDGQNDKEINKFRGVGSDIDAQLLMATSIDSFGHNVNVAPNQYNSTLSNNLKYSTGRASPFLNASSQPSTSLNNSSLIQSPKTQSFHNNSTCSLDSESTVTVSSLKREIRLLELLLKQEKVQKQQLQIQNASLKNAVQTQQALYDRKVRQLEKRNQKLKEKLQQHTQSAEYQRFILKEIEYEKLLKKEAKTRLKIDDLKSEMVYLLMEIEEKQKIFAALGERIEEENSKIHELNDKKLLDSVLIKNLDTGEATSLLRIGEPRISGAEQTPEKVRHDDLASKKKAQLREVVTPTKLNFESKLDLTDTSDLTENVAQIENWNMKVFNRSSEHIENATSLLRLPSDLLENVFSFLNVKDLCTINLCSTLMYEISSSDTVWVQIYHNYEYPSIDNGNSFRPMQYKLRCILCKYGLISFLNPIQFFELHSCAIGVMGKYRMKILSMIRKSPYLDDQIPKKVRISPQCNVRRGMTYVIFFHIKHTLPRFYALACNSNKYPMLKSAMLHHQMSRSLLEVRSKEAYVQDVFTRFSESVFNQNDSISLKILKVEDMIIEYISNSLSSSGSRIKITRGGFVDCKSESYISEFDENGQKISEGRMLLEIRNSDLSVVSFSIVGSIIDKYCDDRTVPNLSQAQRTLEKTLEIQLKHLPHRISDIRTVVDYLRIKKKSTGEQLPCLYYSHELNFYAYDIYGRTGCRKKYEIMCTPVQNIVFHYRNQFKRRDYIKDENFV